MNAGLFALLRQVMRVPVTPEFLWCGGNLVNSTKTRTPIARCSATTPESVLRAKASSRHSTKSPMRTSIACAGFVIGAAAYLGLAASSGAALTITLRDPFYPGHPEPDKPALTSGGSITATFQQDGADKVILTIQADLKGSDFVKGESGQEGLWFNYGDNTSNPTGLTFTFDSSASTTGLSPTVVKGLNAYKADGDGWYDIGVYFGGGANFSGTAKAVFAITAPGLTEGDFLSYSVKKNDGTLYTGAEEYKALLAAAHVQGLAGDKSTFIFGTVVPEPSTQRACVKAA